MPSNTEVAEVFRRIADLLDVLGEKFKPEAYRRAARSLESLPENVSKFADRGELRSIPGVGDAIEEKIRELLSTGKVHYLEKLEQSVPPGVVEIMRLPGLGPKTARRFWVELGIEGPAELRTAIEAGRLNGVKGFGDRKVARILEALAAAGATPSGVRAPIESVVPLARAIVEAVRTGSPVEKIEIAGSYRRGRETVGDLDLLVTSNEPEKVFDRFSGLPEVKTIRMRGGTKETVILTTGLQVDLRVVEPVAFGAALQYFTGSKDHNVRVRSLARDLDLKVNEYGVFRGEERVAGATEEEVYRALGLAWIPPELREDKGEVDLARAGKIPTLVERGDLRGDLHVHLTPDGASARSVGAGARARGLAYLGVVVAGGAAGGAPAELPARALRELAEAAGPSVRILRMVEQSATGAPSPVAADAILLLGGDGSAGPASSTTPAAAVVHVGGSIEAVRPAILLAAARGCAIEVGPGVRLDSSGARAALAEGVPLSLPTGVGDPGGEVTETVAIGFARRAGATRAEVRNAAPWDGATGRRPTGSKASRSGS